MKHLGHQTISSGRDTLNLNFRNKLLDPINLNVYNKNIIIENKAQKEVVGRDLFNSFQKHFATILWRNYKIFKIKKGAIELNRKIRGVKKLLALYSKRLLIKFYQSIIGKIKLIQRNLRYFITKRLILQFYFNTKDILKFRKCNYLRQIKINLKLIKNIKMVLKERAKFLYKNSNKVISRQMLAISANLDLTSMCKARQNYELRIKLKLLICWLKLIKD